MCKENWDALKLLADSEKSEIVSDMIKNDAEYQDYLKKFELAEKLFNSLIMPDTDKAIVMEYMTLWDNMQTEYATYAYLAGIKNAGRSNCKTHLSN